MRSNGMKTKFSESLRSLMTQYGYNQTYVAQKIGVPPPAIHKGLKKGSDPPATNIYNLAKFFEVTSDFLLGLAAI